MRFFARLDCRKRERGRERGRVIEREREMDDYHLRFTEGRLENIFKRVKRLLVFISKKKEKNTREYVARWFETVCDIYNCIVLKRIDWKDDSASSRFNAQSSGNYSDAVWYNIQYAWVKKKKKNCTYIYTALFLKKIIIFNFVSPFYMQIRIKKKKNWRPPFRETKITVHAHVSSSLVSAITYK